MSHEQARKHADDARECIELAQRADWASHDEMFHLKLAQVHATLAVAEAAIPPTPEEKTA